ncbi:MAG: hypothetical protein LQ343_005520 [Gyalolechia ehrenbergii]|nr:MAG: hypothetical protein LQ343_005520 [Gyalolechia ehrenbergii]
MYIRRATALDFPTLASFSVPAFINDELYQYANPFATKYPEAFRGHFLRRLKQRNAQPGFIVWVAVNDADQGPAAKEFSTQDGNSRAGAEEILGYAVWCRYGGTEAAKVNPKFQRRGVGARLISWGLQQAADEKVPVTLSTSTVAEPLYRRMGFGTWARRDLPGIRIGAPSLIHWPPGVEIIENKEEK